MHDRIIQKKMWSFFWYPFFECSLWLIAESYQFARNLRKHESSDHVEGGGHQGYGPHQTITGTTWPVVMLCSRSLVATMQGSSSSASGTNHFKNHGLPVVKMVVGWSENERWKISCGFELPMSFRRGTPKSERVCTRSFLPRCAVCDIAKCWYGCFQK